MDSHKGNSKKLLHLPTDPTVKVLCDRIDKGKLDLHADFQRKYVWQKKPTLRSRLIESALLGIPIPTIYTAELPDGTEEVVDGQQRLATFHSFRKNEFELKNLEVLKELNGKKYENLPDKPINLQDVIDEYGIRVIKVLKESDPEVKFDIFERLNRGSVVLNEQELRNCIYRGNLNDLVKELTNEKQFLSLQKLEKPHVRMVDAQRILRFFAFCDKSERNYTSPVKVFLSKYMENNRNLPPEEVSRKRQLFKKSVELCNLVFGMNAYRRWNNGTKETPDGGFESGINEGIYDIQMYAFMEYEKRQIYPKAQLIKDAFLDLCCDSKFIDTIEKGTYGNNEVKARTAMWFSKLREILGFPDSDRRLYTYEEKLFLFNLKKETCQICRNKINGVDNAQVDHIERYSEGGETKISNGQITHRYCNLSKG